MAKDRAQAPPREEARGPAPTPRATKLRFEDRIVLRDFMCLERPIMCALDRRWVQSERRHLERAARIVTFDLLVTTSAAMNGSIGAWLDALDFCQSSEIPLPKPLADCTIEMVLNQSLQFGSQPRPDWPVDRRDKSLTDRIQYEWIKGRFESFGRDLQWREEIKELQRCIIFSLSLYIGQETVRTQVEGEGDGEPLKGDKVRRAIEQQYKGPATVDSVYREVFMPDMDIIWSHHRDWKEGFNVPSKDTIILSAKTVREEYNKLPQECRVLLPMRAAPEDIAKIYHHVHGDRMDMVGFEWGDPPAWEDFPLGQSLWPGRYYLPTEKSLIRMGLKDLLPAIHAGPAGPDDAPRLFKPNP